MMLSAIWKRYSYETEQVTKSCRQLGYAAAAISWFYREQSGGFPALIWWALVAVVTYFWFDLMQFIVSALVIKKFCQAKEDEIKAKGPLVDTDVDQPKWLDWPSFGGWVAKAVSLSVAYALIGFHVFSE